MQLTKLIQLSKKSKSSLDTGFTLIELLVAASITGIVVSAAGLGLVQMTKSNKNAGAQIERQTEVNRALDFVSDEVRKASAINKASTITTINAGTFTAKRDATTDTSAFSTTGKNIVLALEIPDVNNDNNNEYVIYYTKANTGTNWKGPRVLYRWGPNLTASGGYSQTGNTLNYTTSEEALIDGIDDTAPSACSSGTLAGNSGFAACLGGTQGTGTAAYFTTAQIKIDGEFKKANYNNGTSNEGTDNYKADTQTVSRVNQKPADVNNPSASSLASTTYFPPGQGNKKATFDFPESSYACNNSQDMPVTTQFQMRNNNNTWVGTPSTVSSSGTKTVIDIDPYQDPEKQFNLISTPNPGSLNCSKASNTTTAVNSIDNIGTLQPKIKLFSVKNNGESASTLSTTKYATITQGKSLMEHLKSLGYLANKNTGVALGNSDTIDSNTVIKIPDNKMIFFTEIGNHTDPAATGNDFQDNVIVVTLSNS